MTRLDVVYDPDQRAEAQHGLNRIPPAERVEHPDLKAALVAYEQARGAEHEARRAHIELQQTRPSAEWEDEQALADWIAGGRQGKDPGGKRVSEHDRKTDEARRQAGAARILLQRAVEAVVQAFELHGDTWQADLESDRDQLHSAMGELLTGWERLHADLQRTVANLALAAGTAGGQPVHVYSARIKVPQILDGDVVNVADVLDGLCDLAKPEPPNDSAVENMPVGATPLRAPFAGLGSEPVSLGKRVPEEQVRAWQERDEAEVRARGAGLSDERRAERQSRAQARKAERDDAREADREAAEAVR